MTLDDLQIYSFRRSVNALQYSEDVILLGSNHRNVVELHVGGDQVLSALNMLRGRMTLGDICRFLEPDRKLIEEFRELVRLLLEKGLVEVYVSDKILSAVARFDRQVYYFSDVMGIGLDAAIRLQETIGRFRVGVLGIGGVGSYVVRTLSSMGFGQIAVLDYDRVEESNISRQIFYDYRDIGRLKTEVVKEKVAHISPTTKILDFNRLVESLSDIEPIAEVSDVVVVAIDTPRPQIFDIAARIPFTFDVPTVYGGSVSNYVLVGPTVAPRNSRCLNCVRGIGESFRVAKTAFVDGFKSTYATTLIDPINAFAASIMSLEVVKIATSCAEPLFNQSFFVDLTSYATTQYESLPAGTQCEICNP